jgi:hypothetical protein
MAGIVSFIVSPVRARGAMVKVNAGLVAAAASPQLRCGKNVIFADDPLAGAFRAFIYGVLISARLTGWDY